MPEESRDHVPLYRILVNGGELAQEQRDRIKEIKVSNLLRLPDVCTVSVTYPKAEGIDSHPFDIGKMLEVKLGARHERDTITLFRGDIVTLEPSFGSGGVGLTVRAYDRAHLLHRSRRVRTFQNQTATDIVGKVVQAHGLTFQGESSGAPFDFMQQDNETDWDFIWRLAERVGFEFVVEDRTAHFRKPGKGGSERLAWPYPLLSFQPRVTAIQQVSEVSVAAHDPLTKRPIDVTASDTHQVAHIGIDRDDVRKSFEDAQVHVATEPVKTPVEGRALAQALLDKLANGYIAAEGVTVGNPRVKAGVMVDVEGVGQKFSGSYRVAATTHTLRGGSSYMTTFANSPSHTILGTVGADATSAPDYGAQLVIGVVTNVNDPRNMGRVRVMYPALGKDPQGKDAEGWWARIVAPSAGERRGVLMLPVVGEEVLVGFEHGDTSRPYILGSLYNGKDVPGPELLQDKDGSFAVRSDKKIYTESQKQYTIKSNDKLIVQVTGDVEETYKANWSNDTKGKAGLKATQSFEIQGQSVQVTGTTGVTIESSATVTLKVGGSSVEVSPAGVRISGPLINIG